MLRPRPRARAAASRSACRCHRRADRRARARAGGTARAAPRTRTGGPSLLLSWPQPATPRPSPIRAAALPSQPALPRRRWGRRALCRRSAASDVRRPPTLRSADRVATRGPRERPRSLAAQARKRQKIIPDADPTLNRSPDRSTHSHSMVPGGLDVTSSTTRLTSRTSLVMRFEMRDSTSYGRRVQSAVMASSDDTGRSTIGCP